MFSVDLPSAVDTVHCASAAGATGSRAATPTSNATNRQAFRPIFILPWL